MNNQNHEVITHRWKLLETLFGLGVTIVVATGLVVLYRAKFAKLWPPTPDPLYYSDVLGILLLVEIVILIFRWVLAVMGEMRLLKQYLTDFLAPQPIQIYVWTIIFSILLGTLGYLSDNILACSAIFVAYSLGDIWGHRIRNNQLKRALGQTDKASLDSRASAWKAIELFYLERPQLERSATMMFFSFIALLLAQASRFTSSTSNGPWLGCAAYVVLILNIAVTELVIYKWRRLRDRDLGESYSF
ncbi:MAG: hypothetical protein ACREOW_05935 [Thermodesulfobacteriota bacterium]